MGSEKPEVPNSFFQSERPELRSDRAILGSEGLNLGLRGLFMVKNV